MTDNRIVLVRSRDAGVHTGKLAGANGREVTLHDARRIWRWRGANTLNEVALRGIEKGYSRVSEPVAAITLLEACEIIDVTEDAAASIAAAGWGQ